MRVLLQKTAPALPLFSSILARMEPVVEFGHALYYPYIEFNSRRWLRTAVLYHDAIGRIYPGEFRPPDVVSPEIQQLRQEVYKLEFEEGFIKSEYPMQFTKEAAKTFRELALANNMDPARRAQLLPALPDPEKPFLIYGEKFDGELLEEMQKLQLAHKINEYEFEVDPICGALYMRTLATHMAGAHPLITDDPFYEAMAYAPETGDTETRADKGFLLANAVFKTLVPIDVESVPFGDLMAFRKDHQDFRLGFHSEIKKMAADLAKLTRQNQIREALDHYTSTLDAGVKKLETRLRLLKLSCVPACFGVSLPSWATAAWGLSLSNPLALVGTLGAVLAVTVGKSVVEHQVITRDSSLGYVHYLRTELAPEEYAGRIIELNLSGLPVPIRYSKQNRWQKFVRRLFGW